MGSRLDDVNREYVSPREAAKILRVHYLTVLEQIRLGKLEALRVGRQYRIPIRALTPRIESKGQKV